MDEGGKDSSSVASTASSRSKDLFRDVELWMSGTTSKSKKEKGSSDTPSASASECLNHDQESAEEDSETVATASCKDSLFRNHFEKQGTGEAFWLKKSESVGAAEAKPEAGNEGDEEASALELLRDETASAENESFDLQVDYSENVESTPSNDVDADRGTTSEKDGDGDADGAAARLAMSQLDDFLGTVGDEKHALSADATATNDRNPAINDFKYHHSSAAEEAAGAHASPRTPEGGARLARSESEREDEATIVEAMRRALGKDRLYDVFHSMDLNESGELSRRQLRLGLQNLDLSGVGDHRLKRFVSHVVGCSKSPDKAQAQSDSDAASNNDSQMICFQDFWEVFETGHVNPSKQTWSPPVRSPGHSPSSRSSAQFASAPGWQSEDAFLYADAAQNTAPPSQDMEANERKPAKMQPRSKASIVREVEDLIASAQRLTSTPPADFRGSQESADRDENRLGIAISSSMQRVLDHEFQKAVDGESPAKGSAAPPFPLMKEFSQVSVRENAANDGDTDGGGDAVGKMNENPIDLLEEWGESEGAPEEARRPMVKVDETFEPPRGVPLTPPPTHSFVSQNTLSPPVGFGAAESTHRDPHAAGSPAQPRRSSIRYGAYPPGACPPSPIPNVIDSPRFEKIDYFASHQDIGDANEMRASSAVDSDAFVARMAKVFEDLDASFEGSLQRADAVLAMRCGERIAKSLNDASSKGCVERARAHFEAYFVACELNGDRPLSKQTFLSFFDGRISPDASKFQNIEKQTSASTQHPSSPARSSFGDDGSKDRKDRVEEELERTRQELLRAHVMINEPSLNLPDLGFRREQPAVRSIAGPALGADDGVFADLKKKIDELTKITTKQASELRAMRSFSGLLSVQSAERDRSAASLDKSMETFAASRLEDANRELAEQSVQLATAEARRSAAEEQLEELRSKYASATQNVISLQSRIRSMQNELVSLQRHKGDAAAHMQAQMLTIQRLQERSLDAEARRKYAPSLKKKLVKCDVRSAFGAIRSCAGHMKTELKSFQRDFDALFSHGHAKIVSERALTAVSLKGATVPLRTRVRTVYCRSNDQCPHPRPPLLYDRVCDVALKKGSRSRESFADVCNDEMAPVVRTALKGGCAVVFLLGDGASTAISTLIFMLYEGGVARIQLSCAESRGRRTIDLLGRPSDANGAAAPPSTFEAHSEREASLLLAMKDGSRAVHRNEELGSLVSTVHIPESGGTIHVCEIAAPEPDAPISHMMVLAQRGREAEFVDFVRSKCAHAPSFRLMSGALLRFDCRLLSIFVPRPSRKSPQSNPKRSGAVSRRRAPVRASEPRNNRLRRSPDRSRAQSEYHRNRRSPKRRAAQSSPRIDRRSPEEWQYRRTADVKVNAARTYSPHRTALAKKAFNMYCGSKSAGLDTWSTLDAFAELGIAVSTAAELQYAIDMACTRDELPKGAISEEAFLKLVRYFDGPSLRGSGGVVRRIDGDLRRAGDRSSVASSSRQSDDGPVDPARVEYLGAYTPPVKFPRFLRRGSSYFKEEASK